MTTKQIFAVAFLFAVIARATQVSAAVGVGAKPLPGAEMLLDGSRAMLDEKWTYWQGPRFASSLPIKWQVVDDPVDNSVDGGHCISSYEEAAAGGKYGAATS